MEELGSPTEIKFADIEQAGFLERTNREPRR
jgi:hypothetical protein